VVVERTVETNYYGVWGLLKVLVLTVPSGVGELDGKIFKELFERQQGEGKG
jgi:hypothetical protein